MSEDWFTVSCDDGAGGRSTTVTGLEVTTPKSGDEMNVVYTIGTPRGYAPGSACVLNIVESRVTDAADVNVILSSVEDFEFTITDYADDTTVFEEIGLRMDIYQIGL